LSAEGFGEVFPGAGRHCFEAALKGFGSPVSKAEADFKRKERRSERIGLGATRSVTSTTISAAAHWYGYGAWDAPYWFVGPEPGMARSEGDNLVVRCNAWARLCGGRPRELLDCIDHHRAFRHMKFFRRTIRMRRLILDEVMRPPTQARKDNSHTPQVVITLRNANWLAFCYGNASPTFQPMPDGSSSLLTLRG
jgi:hypothetical protein